jgi:hypothetical protein
MPCKLTPKVVVQDFLHGFLEQVRLLILINLNKFILLDHEACLKISEIGLYLTELG